MTVVKANMFDYCTILSTVRLGKVTSIESTAFRGCHGLITADFPVAEKIDSYCFRRCDALETLIIRTPAVAQLVNKNALQNTLIDDGTGFIYVPSALVETYKTTTNWVTYASQFRAIEDYPRVTEV